MGEAEPRKGPAGRKGPHRREGRAEAGPALWPLSGAPLPPAPPLCQEAGCQASGGGSTRTVQTCEQTGHVALRSYGSARVLGLNNVESPPAAAARLGGSLLLQGTSCGLWMFQQRGEEGP